VPRCANTLCGVLTISFRCAHEAAEEPTFRRESLDERKGPNRAPLSEATLHPLQHLARRTRVGARIKEKVSAIDAYQEPAEHNQETHVLAINRVIL